MIKPDVHSTTVRWRLSHGLPLTEALRVGEAMHSAALGCLRLAYGPDAIPPVLSGHGLPSPGWVHQHAFHLAEAADLDGWIDHLVIHADAGLPDAAIMALHSFVPRLPGACLDMWAGDGRASRAGGLLLGASRRWVSMTPYLPPWHRKKRAGLVEHLLRELGLRGLPVPLEVHQLPGVSTSAGLLEAEAFVRRRMKGPPAPMLPGWFLLIEFPETVTGPLALGYGCHFGLGLFQPVSAA